ncbi:MAG: hypothetical protein AB7T19_08950 [Planctomycetota bacterium]
MLAGLPNDLAVALQVLGVAVALLWLVTRIGPARQSVRWIARYPALLVPTVMVGIAAFSHANFVHFRPLLHEHPLWATLTDYPGSSLETWVWFGIVSGGFAGQIGLLDALKAGRQPDGLAFLAGIRRHFLSVSVARLALIAGTLVLGRWANLPHAQPLAAAVLLLPNVLLAPAFGMASRYPGQPIRTLHQSLAFSGGRQLSSICALVVAQAILIFGLAYARWTFDSFSMMSMGDPVGQTALASSVLGFNVMPHGYVTDSPPAAVLATLASMVGSAIFTIAHWLGVNYGYESAMGSIGPRAAAVER